jgi:general secretion pathway protein G
MLTNGTSGQGRRAFTLIEILIVVVILGILAAIVIPQFSNASHEAREATLKDCLRYLRTQVVLFKEQHHDAPPGFPNCDLTQTPDSATYLGQMTQYTSELGAISATTSNVFQFGPYLSQMPSNPLSSLPGVWVVTGATPAPDSTQPFGWIYNASTQELIANLTGSDSQGVPYASY